MGRVFYTDLPSSLRFTLLALADHANDDGGGVFVGKARLARKVGLSVRAIYNNLRALRTSGYLIHEGRTGPRGTARYRIALAMLPDVDRQSTADRQKLPIGSSVHVEASRSAVDCTVDRQPTSSEPSVEPSEKKQPSVSSPRAGSRSVLEASFLRFWAAYPPRNGRRDGKPDALAEWLKLKPDKALEDVILTAVVAYGRSTDYPKDACRWLKGQRWTDETVERRSTNKVHEMAETFRAQLVAKGKT